MQNRNIWELRGMIELLVDNEDELVNVLVPILDLPENDFISQMKTEQPVLANDTNNPHQASNETIEIINNNIKIVIEYCNKQSVNDLAIICYLIQLACYEKLNRSDSQHKPNDQWIAEKQAELSNRYEKFARVCRNEMNSIRRWEYLSYRAKQLEPAPLVRLAFSGIFFSTAVLFERYVRYANDNDDCVLKNNEIFFFGVAAIACMLNCFVQAPTAVSFFADHSFFARKKSPMLEFIQPPSPPKVSAMPLQLR